jgi:peptidoglycan pentaglycine glycine transferase (the first glycine)
MLENTESKNKFIQGNSPDGGFLQSEEWRKFQESVGRKTFHVESEGFWANVVEHKLPIVGKYFYIPRGPIMSCNTQHETCNKGIKNLIELAKRENAGWIRIDANNSSLDIIRNSVEINGNKLKIVRAPHDMQPREILVMDITKLEEQLLAEMKAKTRYNIKLSQKHGISLRITNPYEYTNNKDVEEFLKLVKITAERDKITTHPESYYRKMFDTIPPENLKLYVAEYQNKVIAANIVVFYGNAATYLHGASDNEYRNVMAPYLLQWQAMMDAKRAGFAKYDLGGIRTCNMQRATCSNGWVGITRFKLGFAPSTKPFIFPGSYDIILNPFKYRIYRIIQKIKSLL